MAQLERGERTWETRAFLPCWWEGAELSLKNFWLLQVCVSHDAGKSTPRQSQCQQVHS